MQTPIIKLPIALLPVLFENIYIPLIGFAFQANSLKRALCQTYCLTFRSFRHRNISAAALMFR